MARERSGARRGEATRARLGAGPRDGPSRPLDSLVVFAAATSSSSSSSTTTLVLLAVDAALYPTLLAAVVILLAQARPVRLLAAYLAGGLVTSVAVGLVIVLALGGSSSLSQSSGLSWGADLAIGGLALLVALALALRADERVRRHNPQRRPPHDAEAKRDPWSQRILARGSAPVVFVAALAINLPGAAYLVALKDIAVGHHSTAGDIALILLFNAIMFALAEIPLLGLLLARERTQVYVRRMDHWASSHGRAIAIGLSVALGAFLVARGLAHAT